MFDRANERRRNSEFDEAMNIYESILAEDNTIAEAYWGIVLCRYGIEYVKDPQTLQMKPTCHRTILSSIFADAEYQKALQHADVASRRVYEMEAAAIDQIQKKIIEISSKEKPYDVFICYKENEEGVGRTEDSIIAQDICTYLTNEGLNVFFARITLRAMAGTAYEPYIFAALQSARVMIVIGTKVEYFQAPWVKNEWSRFLAMMRQDKGKVLIPCYNDMLPEMLPAAFANAEALNISTSTFMLDLIRSIRKTMPKKEKVLVTPKVVQGIAGDAESLRKRADIFLQNREFQAAEEYYEKSLDIAPESAASYWGVVMAKCGCSNEQELIDIGKRFTAMNEYKNAVQFADNVLKKQINSTVQAIEAKITDAVYYLKTTGYQQAVKTGLFELEQSGDGPYREMEERVEKLLKELKEVEQGIVVSVKECRQNVVERSLAVMQERDNEMCSEILVRVGEQEAFKDNQAEQIRQRAHQLLQDVRQQKEFMEQSLNGNASFLRLQEQLNKKQEILRLLEKCRNIMNQQIDRMDKTLQEAYAVRNSYKPAWEAVETGIYDQYNMLKIQSS